MRVRFLLVSFAITLACAGCSLMVDFDREKIDGGTAGSSSALALPDAGVAAADAAR